MTDNVEETEQPEETFTATVQGREIELRPLSAFQLGMLIRALKRIQGDDDATGEDIQRTFMRTTGVIESGIVKPEDLDWVIDQVMERKITDQELFAMFLPKDAEKPKAPAHGPTRARRAKK